MRRSLLSSYPLSLSSRLEPEQIPSRSQRQENTGWRDKEDIFGKTRRTLFSAERKWRDFMVFGFLA